jgi:hypothetical protein
MVIFVLEVFPTFQVDLRINIQSVLVSGQSQALDRIII